MSHKISNAYEAYWFIYHHPKMCLAARIALQGNHLKPKHWRVVRDLGGNKWAVSKTLFRHAIDENLSIFYAKVDRTKTTNKDKKKNKFVECWLEFGPIRYGYNQPEFEAKDDHKHSYTQYYHDATLDCGASTFDKALVILARLVREQYGDYKEKEGKD